MKLKTKLRETQKQRIEKSKVLLREARELLNGINHEVYMYENKIIIKKIKIHKRKYKKSNINKKKNSIVENELIVNDTEDTPHKYRRISIRHKNVNGKNCKLRKPQKSTVKKLAFEMRKSILLASELEGLVSLNQLCEIWRCSLPTATETAKALDMLQKNKHNKINGRNQIFFDITHFKDKNNK